MARDRYPRQALGALHLKIKQARVLLVGAGGIGCELLKNLVLTGFGEVHIVDLDTIDISNLNRQFLFRHEHIKKPKALVAKESARKFNPHITLEAHHANIRNPQFNIDWFRSFDLVFNALDNLDARRHVNKMCLAAEVPLIESGTTGFNGQVQVIVKGKTECYDCTTKEVPKSFPVCTIRSTPSQPIHCIVWAKSYLFTEMFGTSEDESPEFDHSEDSENAREIEKLRQESQALNIIRESMGSEDFVRKVFEKVFVDDINRLGSIEDIWKTRKRPVALDFDALSQSALGISTSTACQVQRVWTEAENFTVFCDSMRRLSKRLQQAQCLARDANSPPPVLVFDKDDEDALNFVAASANLRSLIFGIEPKSKFDIKQMAGNIIPAIATTNAMTAGLCVMQAFKILREELSAARMVFLERNGARVINSDTLKPPNPNCTVCGVVQSRLTVDPERAILKDLVEEVLKKQLEYGEEITINTDVGTIYDPELDDNLPKKFLDLGIQTDSFITVVDDDEENPRVNLSLSILESPLPSDSKPVVLPSGVTVPRKPKVALAPSPAPLTNGTTNGHAAPIGTSAAGMKRKRSLEESSNESHQALKKWKMVANTSIFIEDSHDGAIVIDDS
ncbi:MAG: hypothetical protein Q9163_000513 [Psora crenata]